MAIVIEQLCRSHAVPLWEGMTEASVAHPCGPGVWGEPLDRPGAKRVLMRAVELGITLVDTADAYGPEVNERFIAETLYPYPKGLIIATKGGLRRPRREAWENNGRPEHLRAACEASLRRLKLERIDIYQLHAPDPQVPLDESVSALAELQSEGKIRHIGLSNISVASRIVTPVLLYVGELVAIVIALNSDGSAAVSVTVPRDIIVLAVAVVAVTVSWATDTNPEAWSFKVYPLGQLGLRFGALIGHGAGYGVYDKLKEALGTDVNYFFNVDPISIWLTNEKALKPGLAEIIKMVGEEYIKARPETVIKSAHVGMAASNTYVLLTEVLPLAIKKYGGFDADALRSAALSVDLPEGGTMLGFGVKFGGEETSAPGQNDRAFPVIIQYIDDKSYVVWPKSLQVREPVLPLPASSPYAEQ